MRAVFRAAVWAPILITTSTLVATVRLVDVTAQAGISFTHINGARGGLHIPETMGSGGGFLDYDGDGNLDIYLVNSGSLTGETSARSVLYRNTGDGTFIDVTAMAGVEASDRYGMGCAVGDYDNDGDPDLYVTAFGPNLLYRNDGDGSFTDVTASAGVGDPAWSAGATFCDIDLDGDLDLYVANYVEYDLGADYPPCMESGLRTYCHPRHFDGAPDVLYRNNGDGTFSDTTREAGILDLGGPNTGKGLGVVAADLNNDGAPDIYVANDDTPNFLFQNDGTGRFTEIALISGCAYSGDGVAQAGMGVDVGDYDGDGLMDIFVTNLSYETNALYRSTGDGFFEDVSYTARVGEESYLYVGFGTGFVDLDNDGFLDLFVANGHILPNIASMTDTVTYAQPAQVFLNTGGAFIEATNNMGADFQMQGVARAAIFGDYDNDGDMDVVVTHSNGSARLLRNDGGNIGSWLRVSLLGAGGIGARVTVTVGGREQIRDVRRGSSYLASHDPRILFGVGNMDVIDRVHIRWP
ncbi:MAG: CRTAC1 family protein, partial [Candidatus Poribacteria bacterium]